jgi:Reverse transcriptase (RNA-dependent DNA polymerase)/Endonuclease-reverse transcriptase
MMNNNQNSSSIRRYLSLGSNIKICHINIEGISVSKSEYLARLMLDADVDIVAIQETHASSDENLQRRGTLPGYSLIGAIHSSVHGIATYVRTSIPNCRIIFQDHSFDVQTLAIEVDGITVINVYKPPNASWANNPLKIFPHPAVYVGDFNSHNQLWGYEHNDTDGNLLQEWMTLNKLHLIYHPKDKGTFLSARWRKDYTPDLSIITRDSEDDIIDCTRHIFDSFPRSQHRPVLLHYGARLPLTESIPKPRWNFKAADWESFARDIDHVVQFIPASSNSYERFANAIKAAAKRHVPRGFREQYVPGWDRNCEILYQEYQSNHDTTTATRLLEELNKQRKKKWEQTVESTSFVHSSRKAWNLMRKLGTDLNTATSPTNQISANDIASRLLRISKVPMEENFVRSTKRDLRQKRRELTIDTTISADFSLEDLNTALLSFKSGKAAGFDGVYPEFIKNAGLRTKEWILSFFNDVLNTGKLPKLFKQTKVITILKPGKNGSDASHFRPISLLSVVFKLLERIILQRIQPLIDEKIPTSQAGFRKHRSCTEQVLALTSHIEAGFQRKLKTGAVFIDLTAAYDTVWREGLMLKFMRIVPCTKLAKLMNNMLSNRYFQVFLGDKSSRWRRLNNGLPQGSVLAPILFNLYLSDIPTTMSKQFQYADDIVLTFQARSIPECGDNLEIDLETINEYFRRWRLQPNPTKTESCVFHLSTHEAYRVLDIKFADTPIQHVDHPKYLGVTLDRSLTYNVHLTKTAKKVAARVNLVRKLAGTNWGANAATLRTASLALVYSTAEYCAPVWLNSVHVSKIDVQLNNTMRIISGTVKSTQLQWLPVLANIAPPEIRREAAAIRELVNCRRHARSLLYEQMADIPSQRLVSRKPVWSLDPYPSTPRFSIADAWITKWSENLPVNGDLILDPNARPPGFEFRRREWVLLNRFRTNHGRCAFLMHRWRLTESPNCDCGEESQTMLHIVNECPGRSFPGGLRCLNEANPDAMVYLSNLDLDL